MNPKHNMCPGRIRPKSNYLEASSRTHMLIESDTCPLSILHELVHIHVGHRKGLGVGRVCRCKTGDIHPTIANLRLVNIECIMCSAKSVQKVHNFSPLLKHELENLLECSMKT